MEVQRPCQPPRPEGIFTLNKSSTSEFKKAYPVLLLRDFRQRALFYFITGLCVSADGGRQPEKLSKYFFLLKLQKNITSVT